jgi:hypothetical protein
LPGQIGGFAQQEVLYGSHTLRVLGRTAYAHHFSIGVLFVDLSTAFHSLIREMVVGIADPGKLQYVLQALHWSTDAQQRLQWGRELPCLLDQLGAPPYLVRLLRNVHDSTWTTINGQDFIRTHRGTRPGSPIADAIFHYIMYDFSMNLKAYLDEAGHTAFVRSHMQMEVDMIIWLSQLLQQQQLSYCQPSFACSILSSRSLPPVDSASIWPKAKLALLPLFVEVDLLTSAGNIS